MDHLGQNPASIGNYNNASRESLSSPGRPSSIHSQSGHRPSFAEGLRSTPGSPRVRHPSLTPLALHELLNHPARKPSDPRFAGRDWSQIQLGELVDAKDVKYAEYDTSVEAATKTLIESGPPNVILIRDTTSENKLYDTFDYSDLNAYLLVVLGQAHPVGPVQISTYDQIARKAHDGIKIPLSDIKRLVQKPPINFLYGDDDLSKAVEVFAGGAHRILIVKRGSADVVGILSQWRLVSFLWDNGASFPSIDNLYSITLKDLELGSKQIIGINGDQPLVEALKLMHSESLTSVAVTDNAMNVVGNISTVDVKLLTSSSSMPLLQQSCVHFISVILSERGIENGKDSVPVFTVTYNHTLAYTVNKLVATRSHRMWLVEDASPATSMPSTPLATNTALTFPHTVPHTTPHTAPGPPASPKMQLAGAVTGVSGRLSGVVSLTDIINLFARRTGLDPDDPDMQRRRRRRTSSISTLSRPSFDGSRRSMEIRR